MTNNADKEYQRLLDLILTNGRRKKNRTGTDTIGVFGAQARFNLQEGFPLLTTKKMFYKGIIHELLWFISGSTNIKYLVDNGVNIWNKDAFRNYQSKIGRTGHYGDYEHEVNGNTMPICSVDKFVEKVKTDTRFAAKWGDLGEGTYGGTWRGFPYAEYWELPRGVSHDGPRMGYKLSRIDQLDKAINKLKTNPDDRRIIVSAWHPYWSEKCTLAPCHVLYQFNTEELNDSERWELAKKINPRIGITSVPEVNKRTFDEMGLPTRRLSCQLYQRSCDFPLGIPYNWASYALLIHMVAQCVGMVAGDFIWTGGDCHIYENQLEGVKEQLKREPLPLSTLKLNPEVKDLFAFKFGDITIENYQSHPKIDFPLSVG